MRLDTSTARRVGVYFFYDPEGVVDEYIMHWLRSMDEHLTRLIVVCNGALTDESEARLREIEGIEVERRPNSGFDVWAYKHAIDLVGWDELATFDELILMNFTVFGPVDTFTPMFTEMDSRDLDFWGITIHNGAEHDPWGIMPDGTVPVHIQSHFIAVRNRMLRSEEFQRYWDDMFPVLSYVDSVGRHESLFTTRFEKFGFSWGVYVDTFDLVDDEYYPLFHAPVELMEQRNSPIFKRKAFFAPPGDFLQESPNRSARQVLDYLIEDGRFDVDLIWPHIIRSANHQDIATALNLVEILPTDAASVGERDARVVALVGIERERDVPATLKALSSLPREADILLSAPEPIAASLRESLTALGFLGAIESAPASSSRSVVDDWLGRVDHDLVCVVERAEVDGPFPRSNLRGAREIAVESALVSRGFVDRVLDVFTENPYLGLLVSLPPVHGEYFGAFGHEWGESFDAVAEALAAAGLSVPIDPGHAPVAPISGVYWLRGSSLDALRSTPAAFADLDADAFRRVLPFISQASGHYSGYLAPAHLAANTIVNLTHALRSANATFDVGSGDSLVDFDNRLGAFMRQTSSQLVELDPPRSAHVTIEAADRTRGESLAVRWEPSTGVSREIRIFVEEGTRSVRLDPTVFAGAVLAGFSASTDDGSVLPTRIVGGVRLGRFDFLLGSTAHYLIDRIPPKTRVIRVRIEQHAILTSALTPGFAELGEAKAAERGPAAETAIAAEMTSALDGSWNRSHSARVRFGTESDDSAPKVISWTHLAGRGIRARVQVLPGSASSFRLEPTFGPSVCVRVRATTDAGKRLSVSAPGAERRGEYIFLTAEASELVVSGIPRRATHIDVQIGSLTLLAGDPVDFGGLPKEGPSTTTVFARRVLRRLRRR